MTHTAVFISSGTEVPKHEKGIVSVWTGIKMIFFPYNKLIMKEEMVNIRGIREIHHLRLVETSKSPLRAIKVKLTNVFLLCFCNQFIIYLNSKVPTSLSNHCPPLPTPGRPNPTQPLFSPNEILWKVILYHPLTVHWTVKPPHWKQNKRIG